MKIILGDGVELNIQRLIETRLLLQANSGGGKSWALRRILEQSHGHVQQIVIDTEDEFYTLREKHDYILVRHEGGDCVPEVRSAELLATRVLELGVSAIISIYELSPRDRREFVKRFLTSLVNAPKKLWHRALIVIDEAHEFCPEQGRGNRDDSGGCAEAVIGLMAKGRKRGFCGLLATQRLSKLNKDAAAEANNKLIGRATIDVDRKRAAEELGFTSKEDILSLRKLSPGEFFAFGPAISDDVIPLKFGGVETTHPKAGAAPTPVAPPKHKVQSVLAQLADLPQEAEQERATIAELQKQIHDLKRANTDLAKAAPKTETKVETKTIYAIKDSQITRLEKLTDRIEAIHSRTELELENLGQRVREELEPVRDAIAKIKFANTEPRPVSTSPAVAKRVEAAEGPARDGHKPLMRNRAAGTPSPTGSTAGDTLSLGGGVKRCAIAIAQRRNGATREQLTTLTGLRRSTRNRYLQHLTSKEMAAEKGGRFFITEAGLAWLGDDYELLPEGVALQRYWLNKLPGSQSDILRVVLENPAGISREEISAAANLKRSTRNRYLQHLQAQELVIANGETITPAPELLES